jgi:hypothetical protein
MSAVDAGERSATGGDITDEHHRCGGLRVRGVGKDSSGAYFAAEGVAEMLVSVAERRGRLPDIAFEGGASGVLR